MCACVLGGRGMGEGGRGGGGREAVAGELQKHTLVFHPILSGYSM